MTNKEIDRYRDRCFDLWDEDKTEMTIEKVLAGVFAMLGEIARRLPEPKGEGAKE